MWWVRQAILHALAEHAGSFRLPQKQANNLYRLERIRSLLGERFGRAPTEKELSEEVGISIDDVRVLTRASRGSLSLNEPIASEGDSELGDLLEQTGIPDTDELLLRKSFTSAINDALTELPERERRVLELRFGLTDDQPKTLREIGEIMELSRERVRQMRAALSTNCDGPTKSTPSRASCGNRRPTFRGNDGVASSRERRPPAATSSAYRVFVWSWAAGRGRAGARHRPPSRLPGRFPSAPAFPSDGSYNPVYRGVSSPHRWWSSHRPE